MNNEFIRVTYDILDMMWGVCVVYFTDIIYFRTLRRKDRPSKNFEVQTCRPRKKDFVICTCLLDLAIVLPVTAITLRTGLCIAVTKELLLWYNPYDVGCAYISQFPRASDCFLLTACSGFSPA